MNQCRCEPYMINISPAVECVTVLDKKLRLTVGNVSFISLFVLFVEILENSMDFNFECKSFEISFLLKFNLY